MRSPIITHGAWVLPVVTCSGALPRGGSGEADVLIGDVVTIAQFFFFSKLSDFSFIHLSRDRSCLEPLERTRTEIESVSGLLVGGAAQARRVIDAVGAGSRKSVLLGDLKRFRRPASACERRQPYALLARVVVNDVVGARSTFEPAAAEPARPYHRRS
jgi:hypothetical protein